MEFPSDLKYTEDHEWVRLEGSAALVGITDYAQSELGDIVFLELPEVGSAVEQGATFGTIEAVKTVSDLYAPISGEIAEVNHELDSSPEKINESPYDNGWMLKIEVKDVSEYENLMDAEGYKNHIGESDE